MFIDEEKEGDDIANAVDDIINKFAWIPNLRRLPFFIGIAFSFNHIRIVRLTRNAPHHILFSHALGSFEDRLAVLQPAVNIARVLKHFVESDMITPAGLSMGKWHDRSCGKQIKLSLHGVEVKCEPKKFKFLKSFYDACKDIPFLERLIESDAHKRKLTLGPLGLPIMPATVQQFHKAVKCIATALYGMHTKGYVHTDIRWSNIVLKDNDDWMLIDCYESCKLTDESELRKRATARNVIGRNWSKLDDLAQLAQLGAKLAFAEDVKSLSVLMASADVTLDAIVVHCDSNM